MRIAIIVVCSYLHLLLSEHDVTCHDPKDRVNTSTLQSVQYGESGMNAPEFRRRVMAQERPGLSRESLSFAVEYFVSQHRLSEGDFHSCIELAGRYESERPRLSVDTAVKSASAMPISLGAVIASEKWADELRPSIEKWRQEIFGSPRPPFQTSEDARTVLMGSDKGEMVEQAAKDIAEATGLSQSAVATYILAGIRPFVSSAEIRVQDFKGPLQGKLQAPHQ
jgi:hypothetical protein